jgi:hypothetical protein
MTQQPLRITDQDLFDPRVEGFLEEQAVINRAAPEIPERSLFAKIFYSSYFYLGLAGGLGALAGWGVLEPFFEDGVRHGEGIDPAKALMFPTVAAGIGLFLGAAEGIISRNFLRALICGAVGLGVGFGGGLLSLIPTGIVFSIMAGLAAEVGHMKPRCARKRSPGTACSAQCSADCSVGCCLTRSTSRFPAPTPPPPAAASGSA